MKNAAYILAAIAACLVAVWPLPETMALRYLLLISGCVLSIYVIKSNRSIIFSKYASHIWMLFSFFLWLTIHLFIFSNNYDEQLYEFQGAWVRVLLSAICGVALGLSLSQTKQKNESGVLEKIIITGFYGAPIIFFLRYAYEIYVTGNWVHTDFYMYPYLSKTPIVVFGSLLLPLIYIKIIQSDSDKEKKLWVPVGIVGILLVLFAEYFSNTKNGIGFFILVLTAFLIYFLSRSKYSFIAGARRRSIIFIIAACILIPYGLFKHIEANHDWRTPWADFKVGLDIENNQHWKNSVLYDYPKNEYGAQVSTTVYLRTAWIVVGVQLIKENPQGYGLLHHSYGALAIEKWPDFNKQNVSGKTRGSTHSGWVDFTLGLGIPGLMLVILPLWISFFRALQRQGFWYSYICWAVPLITAIYLTTEVASDHFFEFLFFMIALFCGLTLQKPEQATRLAPS